MNSEETGVQQEGQTAFPAEMETPKESPTETNQTDESSDSSAEDKKQDVKAEVPFHEHPRFKELIEEKNTLKSELQELRSFKEQTQPLIERFTPKDEITPPAYWGGDADSYKLFLEDQRRLAQEAEERAVQRIKAEREGEDKRIRDANEWFEKSVSDIESSGFKVDRNKLLKTAMDFDLVDTLGRWNYKAAAEILKRDDKPIDLTEKKQVAASATSEATPERKPKDYLTPGILRRKGW
jgi:hypothetical protein